MLLSRLRPFIITPHSKINKDTSWYRGTMSTSPLNRSDTTPRKESALRRMVSFIDKDHLPLVDIGDPTSFTRELIVPDVAPSLKPAVDRAMLGFNTVSHHAIDRSKGIYCEVKIYQGEPALGDQVMKSDVWPGIHSLKEPSPWPGVVNFRQVQLPGNILVPDATPARLLDGPANKTADPFVPSLRDSTSHGPMVATPLPGAEKERVNVSFDLFGAGQPTYEGLHHMVKHLLLVKSYKQIIWINLREEPVLYINGSSFAPRDKDTLNINLEYLLGIEGLDLEDMEGRLKADVRAQTREKGGKFHYYFQTATMGNETVEIDIDAAQNLRTLREIYTELKYDYRYHVDYHRIPITDECAPEEKDFDQIVRVLKDSHPNSAVVFNCQMGRGRTTTGLVCGYLISQMQSGDWIPSKTPISVDYHQPSLERGEFQVILQLISTIPDGELVKAQVDEAIDKCAVLQNLRTAIYDCKAKANTGAENRPPSFWFKRGQNYLERYWWLILFNAYLRKHAPKYLVSFSEWMKNKWKMRKLLRKIELE